MDTDGVLVVFTAKTKEQMKRDGGSWAWVLNPSRMGDIKYVVCVRNADRSFDEECGPRYEPHNSAFFVGKISGIRKIGRENDRDRYIIEFSEYAEPEIVPDFRVGSVRNPVTYSDVGACAVKGLFIEQLEFHPMPPRTGGPLYKGDEVTQFAGLTVEQAKAGLAITHNVPPEAITISIAF